MHGELLAFSRMDNVSVQAGFVGSSKQAYTSARNEQPNGNLGAWAKTTGKDLNYWTDQITGFKGGVPVQHKGQVLGAIGISGLSEDDDEALAEKVIQLVL